MSAETNTAVLHRAVDAWNRGDYDAYLDLYAPDVVYAGVGSGLESVSQFYRPFWSAFPGGQLMLDQEIAEGDKLAVRFHFDAEHRGELMGIPPTGKAVTLSGITILRFADGKCVERWSQSDFLGLLQQLGAIPAPSGVD
jgi:steroid delta-isomerase-like uncharacterized protein